MKIIDSRLCDNNYLRVTYLFDNKISVADVYMLGKDKMLFYNADFPIPYFKIIDNDKYIMRGAVGTNKITIDFLSNTVEAKQETYNLLIKMMHDEI